MGTALLAPLLPEVSIIAGAGYLLGGIGSVGLGLSTGMAITGKDLLGNNLSSFERGKLTGGSLLGWGMLGLGAWDQYRRLGNIFSIKDPVTYPGQGGTIALGRFNDMARLEKFANQNNARILDQSISKGYTLPQYLRGEIISADKIYFRMNNVYPGTVSYDVEYQYIKSNPLLSEKTIFGYE